MTPPLQQVPLFSSLVPSLCLNFAHHFHIIMASSSSSSLVFPHTLLPSLPSSNSINLTFIINYNPTNKPHLLLSKQKSSISPIKCSSSSSISSLIPKLDQENNKHEDQDDDYSYDYVEEEEEVPPLHEIWREIQGCNNWEGLLDPMNPHLRREIIRYGEIAQSCYDSFDFDPHSKYCGTCKYHPSEFLQKLDLTTTTTSASYDITRYLYATSNINLPNFFQKSSSLRSIWSPHANWMGYVGVVNAADDINRLGRRDIVIAWRGTVTYLEWIYDLKDILRSANFRGEGDNSVKIESGFYDLYTKKEDSCNYCSFSAREQVLAEVKRLVEYYGDEEEVSITITGHSLGAALAILSAYDIAEMNVNVVNDGGVSRKIPITVYSFAGPRVGNLRFKERCEELGVKVLRVINVHDKVPTVPGIITNEKFQFQKYFEETLSFPWSYAHVGVELALDHKQSPFLKPTNDLLCAHNLEAHLHLVDGYHGQGRQFRLANKRDIALVNKSCDFLLTEHEVPPHWRQDENKGMVRTSDGRWVVPERPRMEAHPPDTAHHLQQVLKRNGIFQLRDT